MQDEAVGLNECLSCNGMNTSCPDGCGRDPKTGELNGGRCDCDYCAQPSPDVAGLVEELTEPANWRAQRQRGGAVNYDSDAPFRAATTLTTQAARIAALEGERDEARANALADAKRACELYVEWCKNWGMIHNQNVACEAAEEIAGIMPNLPELRLIEDDEEAARAIYTKQQWWIEANEKARAALSETSK